MIVAWLPAGVVAGLALAHLAHLKRTVVAALLGAMLLAFASDASFALARNLKLADVVGSRRPGVGVWIGVLLLARGCARTCDDRRATRAQSRTCCRGCPPLRPARRRSPGRTQAGARRPPGARRRSPGSPERFADADRPEPSATSAETAFINEIAVITWPERSADRNARKPPPVPSRASAAHPDNEMMPPWFPEQTHALIAPSAAPSVFGRVRNGGISRSGFAYGAGRAGEHHRREALLVQRGSCDARRRSARSAG
jgi:hypothetical protein